MVFGALSGAPRCPVIYLCAFVLRSERCCLDVCFVYLYSCILRRFRVSPGLFVNPGCFTGTEPRPSVAPSLGYDRPPVLPGFGCPRERAATASSTCTKRFYSSRAQSLPQPQRLCPRLTHPLGIGGNMQKNHRCSIDFILSHDMCITMCGASVSAHRR